MGTTLIAACGGDSTGPAQPDVRLAVGSGDGQYVLPGNIAEFPLRVRVTDAGGGAAVDGVEVRWRIVSGSGASLLSAAPSDEIGVASVRVQAGPAVGTLRIEAGADRLIGQPVEFLVHVVQAPTLTSVTPTTVTAGGEFTVLGSGFSATTAENAVLVGGLRAAVLTATPTMILARAPGCVLDRTTDVRVALGAVSSNGVPVQTVSGPVQPLQLSWGQAVQLDDPQTFACIDLSQAPAGAEYLLVASDVSPALDLPLRYELLGFTGGVPVAVPARAQRLPARDVASEWEMGLRAREREIGPPLGGEGDAVTAALSAGVPSVGETRAFNVLKPDQKTTRKITAVVRYVSDRAILYVDEDAPASGFTDGDLVGFGQLFDDPIYDTDLATFGPLSDIDANDRVIILFTPAVNALTAPQQNGFIAGYFYGCDLVSAERCSGTNRGEIFYSVVPDPAGEFSDARTKSTVLRTVPPVLAHELQHMINFSRRGSLDVLWLAEGMAHAAEDIVADVFAARGDLVRSDDFRRNNYQRAQLYLRQADAASRINIESPGTLEMRGGAWLFVKYLAGHYGGAALLERLSGSTATGAANVAGATGAPWSTISARFGVALWADAAPELAGAGVDPLLMFEGFDLRAAMAQLSGGYPALAQTFLFRDFLLSAEMPSAAQTHLILKVPAVSVNGFRLAFTGPRGGPFPTGTPRLFVLRIR